MSARYRLGTSAPVLHAFKTGLYYRSGTDGDVGVGIATTPSTLSFSPFPVGRTTTFDRIAIEITTAGASMVERLGIYRAGTDGMPGALVHEASGTIDASTTGAKELTISQTLEPGLYWLAHVPQGGVANVSARGGNAPSRWIGLSALPGSYNAPGLAQASVTGALPATAAAAASNEGGAWVWLRAA